MIALTLDELAAAVDGRVVGDGTLVVDAVTTDSRAAGPGHLFVALRGEHADGHAYVAAAAAAGAPAALVEREDALAATAGVVVENCWRAVGLLGAAVRDRVDPAVLAITGSVGKTSTKDLVRAALAADRPTVAAEGSFNNELGVPLTLLATVEDTRALVVEIGARGVGHIASLTPWVRPDVAIVTAVAGAHLEMFGDLDTVALAKGELVAALGRDGTAVLNRADPRVWAMRERTDAAVLGYGLEDGDVRVVEARHDELGRWRGRVVTPWGEAPLALAVAGRHNLLNALAAVAAAGALGVAPATAAAGLADAALSRWRAELTTRADGLLLVNDAYNANPFSMTAALAMLDDLRRSDGRLVAVLGYMAELGAGEVADHATVGAAAAEVADLVVVVGDRAPLAAMRAAAAEHGTEVVWVAETEAAAAALAGRVGRDDVVLVKASRSAGLERAAQLLLDDTTPRDPRRRPAPRVADGTPPEGLT